MKEITKTIVTHLRVSPRRRSTNKYRPPKNNTDTSNTNNPDVFKNHSTKDSNCNNYDNLRINSNSTNDTDNHYNDNRQQQTRSQHPAILVRIYIGFIRILRLWMALDS